MSSKQQWEWIASQQKFPKEQCDIYLDNDSTYIGIGGMYLEFRRYIGISTGAKHLLTALGYNVQNV